MSFVKVLKKENKREMEGVPGQRNVRLLLLLAPSVCLMSLVAEGLDSFEKDGFFWGISAIELQTLITYAWRKHQRKKHKLPPPDLIPEWLREPDIRQIPKALSPLDISMLLCIIAVLSFFGMIWSGVNAFFALVFSFYACRLAVRLRGK